MKIAVIYNRQSKKVINLFGIPSREKYGLTSIQRVVAALEQGGHQVAAFEGDKDLIPNLEGFMPRVLKGEIPGMALNLAYGIQGQARYTHVPGILEMVGIPYVGSGPLGHSLALDKVVAKMLFIQNNVPTPEFAVIEDENFAFPKLPYPLIVKPKNEAVSFGLRIVYNDDELRSAALSILKEFGQAVLVERYIDGREINVGVLGNGNRPQVFPVAELLFAEGVRIYTEVDKKAKGENKRVSVHVPAELDPDLAARAQDLARRAFLALGLYDCARVDIRLDPQGNLYVLEINSLPSLGENGSYARAAAAAGLDFTALVNRLVDVASERYFGTPTPPGLATVAETDLLEGITQHRDRIEARIQERVARGSRTGDSIGVRATAEEFNACLCELGLEPREDACDGRSVWLHETPASFHGGTLVIANLDVPFVGESASAGFRRDPEWLYGEGVAVSRAPLTAIEFALRALLGRGLAEHRLGILTYADEGDDCRFSADIIRRASQHAARVLVMRPGLGGDRAVSTRRGLRRYRLRVEGKARRFGTAVPGRDPLQWLMERASELSALSSSEARLSVDIAEIRTSAYPMLVPHRVDATVVVSYPDVDSGTKLESRIREVLRRDEATWSFAPLSDRPPMAERAGNLELAERVRAVAQMWHLPFGHEGSVLPSVAGLVPEHVPVLCGMGPVGADLFTEREGVSRVSVVQRTLLLAATLNAFR